MWRPTNYVLYPPPSSYRRRIFKHPNLKCSHRLQRSRGIIDESMAPRRTSVGCVILLNPLFYPTTDNRNSANFVLTAFYEVRRFLGALSCFCALAHIHCLKMSVCCVRYVAQMRRCAKPQDSYHLSS